MAVWGRSTTGSYQQCRLDWFTPETGWVSDLLLMRHSPAADDPNRDVACDQQQHTDQGNRSGSEIHVRYEGRQVCSGGWIAWIERRCVSSYRDDGDDQSNGGDQQDR